MRETLLYSWVTSLGLEITNRINKVNPDNKVS